MTSFGIVGLITVNENSTYVHKWFCNVWIVLHAFGTVKCKNHKSCCVSKFKSCSFNLLIVTERLQIPNSGWTIGQRAQCNKFQSFKRLIIWKSTPYERYLTLVNCLPQNGRLKKFRTGKHKLWHSNVMPARVVLSNYLSFRNLNLLFAFINVIIKR